METAGLAEGNPKHAALIEGIASIRRATIRDLWTDFADEYPTDPTQSRWWELWLRTADGREYERLTEYARQHGLPVSDHYLGFGDRTVVLICATSEQLATTFRSIDDIAELRRPHEVASFLPSLPVSEQHDWVSELQSRVEHAENNAPVVCILDRGVQAKHPLLKGSLAAKDLHAVKPSWNKNLPIHGHGTEMAGLVLYQDLAAAIITRHAVRLEHRLESVKILPDVGSNDPDVYGAVTARAVDQPEITAPDRARVFMLAITAPATEPNLGHHVEDRARQESGRPTTWSATIDALAYGRAIDDSVPNFTYLDRDEETTPRLFVVSAGNIRDVRAEDNHLDRSDAESVEDPAQAWNALVVHSAEWTRPMRARIDDAASKKSAAVNLLRRYGMGVPDLERATRSASNALTLVDEAVIHPYKREGSTSKSREMNLHRLPWPTDVLSKLGETEVQLRVTLSYFVEPNPSRRGWTGRYVYPSHGLRFAMKRPEDNLDAFRQRVNKQARDEGEKPLRLNTETGWLFGRAQQTSSGSLHTDIWTGSAVGLAAKEAVIVYPVAGWWKSRVKMDHSDNGVNYSLVVSIEAPEVEVDLWTPVSQQVAAAVEV